MRDWPEPDQDAWLAYLDHFGEPDDDYYQRLEEAFYEEEAKIRAEADVRVDEGEVYYDPCDNAPYCPICGVCNGDDCGCSCHYGLTKAQEAAAQADYENELAMGAALAAAEEFYKEAQTSAKAATAIASTYTMESTLNGASLANAILTGSKVKVDEVLANAKYAYAKS